MGVRFPPPYAHTPTLLIFVEASAMIKKGILSLVGLLCLTLAACQAEAPREVDTTEPYEHYGEAIDTEGALPVQAILAEPEEYRGEVVKVEGAVADVCQSDGCWLTFEPEEGRPVRIEAARNDEGGHAFTVPDDVSGRRAIVQGILAEDDGEETLVLTATGVLVERA